MSSEIDSHPAGIPQKSRDLQDSVSKQVEWRRMYVRKTLLKACRQTIQYEIINRKHAMGQARHEQTGVDKDKIGIQKGTKMRVENQEDDLIMRLGNGDSQYNTSQHV